MSLYIQQLAKLISNQLGRLYRHFGANSDGAAWFLICTSLISQHLALLRTTSGCQILARRLYRTFARDGFDAVFSGDLKEAFDDNEEAEAAFHV
jgi:hypothetical protein